MITGLSKKVDALTNQTLILLLVIAAGVMYLNYAAYCVILEPYGLTFWTKFLAIVISVVVGVVYYIFFAWLLEIAVRLPRADRQRLLPIILMMTAFIVASSTYPHVILMGGGHAMEASDKAYIEETAAKADILKAAAGESNQFSGIFASGGNALRDLEKREQRGLLSGVDSGRLRPGPVSDWIGSYAARFEAIGSQIAEGAAKRTALIGQIDAAVSDMRSALGDKAIDLAARRAKMQAAGDSLRTAAIALRETAPLGAITSFAEALKGEAALPALSPMPAIRDKQLAAVEAAKAEFRGWAERIEKGVNGAGKEMVLIPPYSPEPVSVLVVKHASELGSVYAAAIAIDLLNLALFFLIAGVNDAMRKTKNSTDELETLTVGEVVRAQDALKHMQIRNGALLAGEGRGGRALFNPRTGEDL